MQTVNFLAQLWGFSLVIIALSLLLKPARAKYILQMMESEHALFLHGVIRLVLGVAMLLDYNTFDYSWKIVMTILGWLLLISGAGLLYMPKKAVQMIIKLKNSDWISTVLIIVILFGCFLISASFIL